MKYKNQNINNKIPHLIKYQKYLKEIFFPYLLLPYILKFKLTIKPHSIQLKYFLSYLLHLVYQDPF